MKKILTLFSALLLTVTMWGAYTMTSISNFSAEFDSWNAATIKFKAEGYNGTATATIYKYDVQFTVYPNSTSSIVGTYSTDDYSFDVSSYTTKFHWLYDNGSVRTGRTLSWGDDEQITIEFVSGYTYRMSGTLKARSTSSEDPKVYNFSDVEFTYGAPAPTYNTYNFDSYINSTNVTVTNNYSVDGSYVLDFTQYGKERVESPSIGSGTSTVQLKIFPATESLVGTFKVSESTLSSNSYVKSSSGNMRYCQNDAYITITKDELGVYTLSGDIYAKNSAGNYFHYYFSASDYRNTFTIPEVQEVKITPTAITPDVSSYSFTLDIEGTPCGGTLEISSSSLTGSFAYDDIGYWTKFNGSYVDSNDQTNTASIVATGNTNEYKLNMSVVCEDGNTYVIENALFTYIPPSPWDSEPAKKEEGITLNISDMGKDFASGVLTLFTNNDDFYVELAFPATEDKLAAGTYAINDTKTVGTIVASPGMGDYYPAPSYLTMYEGWSSYDYFLRSGELTVDFSDDNRKMTINGTAYSFRETPITFNVEVDNPYYVGEETLEVTSITPAFDLYNDSQITFQIAASGTGLLSGAILTVNATELAGEFDTDDLDMELSWVGQGAETSTYLDATKANSIVVTQDGFNYTLVATVYGANGSTYMMEGSFVLAELDEEKDNSALLAAAMGQTVDLDIKRTFASGMWQTICLPFDIADIDASPLAGAIVKSVTSCNLEGETLMVEAVDVTSMTAGMPYLIKWEGSAPLDDSPTFSGVTIAAAEGITSGNFVANMSAKHYDDVTGKYIVVADNGLAPMGTEGSVKGFRAFFQLNVSAGVAPRKFAFATSVVTDNEQISKAVPVRKALVNGQLLIIKNNQVFNAQAQELK